MLKWLRGLRQRTPTLPATGLGRAMRREELDGSGPMRLPASSAGIDNPTSVIIGTLCDLVYQRHVMRVHRSMFQLRKGQDAADLADRPPRLDPKRPGRPEPGTADAADT